MREILCSRIRNSALSETAHFLEELRRAEHCVRLRPR